MELLSAHDANALLINPRDKSISVGWDAVEKNWKWSFGRFPTKFKITQLEGPQIVVSGSAAWSTGGVGSEKSGVFENDVFEKRGGSWLLVSHTALRAPQ